MQYRLEDYRSAEAFRERVLGVMRAVRQRAPKGDLLVVFPEDVGLGLIFTQDFERVQTAKTMVEAGLRLMERYQINAFASEGGFAGATRTLLRTLSPFVERVYHEVFSEAARVGGAWVVAGSAPIAQGECVHNVSYTYNPKGERVLVQRKINLVPLEQEAGLNLCPAPRELPTVNTPVGKLGVLICLDGFYHELIDQHAKRGVRVIAMPSYNPLPWTKEEAQGWETGLLAGVQKHPDMIGVNPMGVGGFFDVRAEGQSSIVAPRARTPDGSGYLARAKSKDQEEILIPIAQPKFVNRTASPPTPPVSNPNPLNAPSHHATLPTHPPPPQATHTPHPLHNDAPHKTHAPLGSTQANTQANTPTPPQPPVPHAPDENPRYPTPRPLPPTHAIRTTPPLPPPSPNAPTNATIPHPTTGQQLPASTATRTNAPPADTT
jgi:predicted amidohydrolase